MADPRAGQAPAVVRFLPYLVLVTIAELLSAIVHPLPGFAIHTAILVALLVHATLERATAVRNFLLALALVPVIRIVSLGLPLGEISGPWRFMLASLPLFATAAALMRMLSLRPRDVGLRLPTMRRWPVTCLVALSGLGLGYLEFLILHPEPLVGSRSLTALWLPALILLLSTGFLEELLFRGILQVTGIATLGSTAGMLYVSALFGVMHIGHLSVLDIVFVAAIALYFALTVRWTKSLLGVTIAHGITNIMLFLILPYVSTA